MPTVSEFHGIVIQMFHTEHPSPHLHATYGEHEGIFGLNPIALVSGRLPRRIERPVLEWAAPHQEENGERGRRLRPLLRIDPLP